MFLKNHEMWGLKNDGFDKKRNSYLISENNHKVINQKFH